MFSTQQLLAPPVLLLQSFPPHVSQTSEGQHAFSFALKMPSYSSQGSTIHKMVSVNGNILKIVSFIAGGERNKYQIHLENVWLFNLPVCLHV